MKIRAAEIADAPAIAALTNELGYAADEATIRARLERLAGRSERIVVVAVTEKGQEVAGWLQADAATTLESGFRVEIVGLVVGEKFRRRGVGRRLMEKAEAWAREVGAPYVVVRSNTQRVESHRFYPAMGYTTTKTQAVYRKALTKT